MAVDEQVVLHIENPDRRGHAAGQRHGEHLGAHKVDAKRLRGILVLTHGHQLRAEARILEPDRDQASDHDQNPGNQIEDAPIGKLEILDTSRQRNQHAETAAGILEGRDEDARDLGEGERHQREICAAQPIAEDEQTDEPADGGAETDRDSAGDIGIHAVPDLQDCGSVRADPEEKRMPERKLAAVSSKHVPGLTEKREHQNQQPERQPEFRSHQERNA